ncbi:FtsX-like permease family protein [Nonomuraea sp. NPDC050790]|uniref:ABC transporter permease n=1 Tax=Nonomuraea sp. NPDC050790 TaxID=3364371 RepID=UPI0037B62C2E
MRGPLIVKRAFSEPLLLLAALGSILLATTTLVALTMYASTIADVGVRRTMETASFGNTAVTVTAPVKGETFPKLDQAIRRQVDELFTGVPTAIGASFHSDSFAMPGQERKERPELLRFGSYDGLDQHAKLVSGTWPREDAQPMEAAVSLPAASATSFKIGQVISTQGRVDKKTRQVKIVGIFQLDDPFGDRWNGEALLSRGVESGSYTTYGPLMVGRNTFLTHFATTVSTTWTALPDLRQVSPEQLRPLAEGVTGLRERLRANGCSECTAVSRLNGVLTQLDTAALVSRSTMLIPVLQLLLLAAYALMLTARLLADHRRMEVALLRSRGAGTWRLASLAGGEALLVAVPCAVVAPFLGPPLLAAVNTLPWIEASGVRLAPVADLGTFLVSTSVALVSAVLLALPALAGARRTYVEEQSARGRSGARGLIERAGADLALLVVAGLAIWQLQHYGAPVTSTTSGELGIDPLIISGPALALLTGGMLGLRLVPRISKVAERFTTKRASLAPALGAWQVARRPLRYSGPALLLTMAIAIGIVSMATASTWRASQSDQARHQAGTDLRLTGPPDGGDLGTLGRGTAFSTLPGVRAAAPAYRGRADVDNTFVNLLAIDAAKLGQVFQLRPDLSVSTVAELGAALTAGRPKTAPVALPGTPRTLTVDVAAPFGAVPLQVVISDALGVRHALPVEATSKTVRQAALDLTALTGRSGEISYPLAVEGFVAGASETDREARVLALRADGQEVDVPADRRWAGGGQAAEGLFTIESGREGAVVMPAPPGVDAAKMLLRPREAGATVNAPLPVVLTADLAAALKLSVGQVAPITFERKVIEVKLAGVVERMPTTTPEQPAVLVDLRTLQDRTLSAGELPLPATEWWLNTGGSSDAAYEKIRTNPVWNVTALDQRRLATEMRDDPLGSGLQGALILGFLAALVFAALGFLVNAAVAARERMSEFTILRALGVSFRQVFGLLAIEQTFVIGLSLAAGTGLAVAVGYLVVPHIVLTGQAAAVTPDVRLDIPWPATAAMLVAVAAVLFAIVAGLARSMRRQGLGQVLRIGEDQ